MQFILILVIFSVALGERTRRDTPTLDGRIVGGTNANIADYPYQISLQLLSMHICGGATISHIWVLTAEHCVEDVRIPSFLSVRAGSSIRDLGGQVHSVVAVISHPSYSRETLDFDIALIRTSSIITATTNARPIPLPLSASSPLVNSMAVITGWGALFENGPAARTLQMVQVPVISQQDCRNAYPLYNITDRMFCAGFLGIGGRDACQGDSGGPAVINGILMGLVSWGTGCARPDSPGVYTNLAILRSWIHFNSGV